MTTKNIDVFPPSDAGFIRQNWRVLLRLLFGFMWLFDAFFKWLWVLNGENIVTLIQNQANAQPALLQGWVTFWGNIAKDIPFFTLIIAIIETIIAVCLILGFFTNEISIIGIIYSFLIWSTAEGFGGIFIPNATSIGMGPLYIAIFIGLIVINAGRQKGIDEILHQKYPGLLLW